MKCRTFIVVLCGIGFTMSGCNRRTFTMPGDAMEPTLRKDERVSFDESAYKNRAPERWDVVTLHPINASDKEMTWALRVVGLPGEQISFSPEGNIVANGAALPRPSSIASIRFVCGRAAEPVTVPAESYYVLGDNTMNAYDSRYWGPVPRANIIGKVIGK
jgi:signal peptidase I